jgi:CheY-like chemotaxis protein
VAKILVADDNSNIQKMVGLALKDQGIDVVAVGNGEAAVRKISDIKPDLVLADVFMPVRNGYEVCRYVKEDSALSHIPVILLVGAFDPLDEQEAQRVGADGVLKKPFVPPDPLISMVKSALQRAGIPLGPAAAQPPAEKPAPVPTRSAADILSGVASRLASPFSQKLPEAEPEPIEEFPTPPAHVKIPEGLGPVAFGNLLDSNETEEPPVFSSRPMINIAEKPKWEEESNDVPEEQEEAEEGESAGAWRRSSVDEQLERAATESKSITDWREEAFHGSSPANGEPTPSWHSAALSTSFLEAAESQSVAVSTLEQKPAEATSPFTSDAWAAAMSATVEDKLVAAAVEEPKASAIVTPEPDATQAQADTFAAASAPAVDEEPKTEPANWAAVPETSWDKEAKRASMLASTWDVAPPGSPDETQEIPVYKAEEPAVESAATEEAAAPSAYSGSLELEHVPSEPAEKPAHNVVSEPASLGALPKSWENTWESPAPIVSAPAPRQEIQAEQPAALETQAEPAEEIKDDTAPTMEPAPHIAETTPVETLPAPNMDELVARVLGKMNPEVLQRVTREILKPVIEAIVRDELDSKK